MTIEKLKHKIYHLPLGRFLFIANLISNPVLKGYFRGAGYKLGNYRDAFYKRDQYIIKLEKFLARYDAWLCPTTSTTAFNHIDTKGLPKQIKAKVEVDDVEYPYTLVCAGYTSIFNMTGNPVVVLPVDTDVNGLPIGVQLVGRRWADMELLNVAEHCSEIAGVFKRPEGY